MLYTRIHPHPTAVFARHGNSVVERERSRVQKRGLAATIGMDRKVALSPGVDCIPGKKRFLFVAVVSRRPACKCRATCGGLLSLGRERGSAREKGRAAHAEHYHAGYKEHRKSVVDPAGAAGGPPADSFGAQSRAQENRPPPQFFRDRRQLQLWAYAKKGNRCLCDEESHRCASFNMIKSLTDDHVACTRVRRTGGLKTSTAPAQKGFRSLLGRCSTTSSKDC